MKRVLVITYYWPPAGGAGVQRWLKFASYFGEFGVNPIILTVDENKATYPQIDSSLLEEVPKDVKVVKTDSFEPLRLYGDIFGKDKIPYGGFANVSKEGLLYKLSRFVRCNFFIPDARIGWNKYALDAALKLIEEHQIDTIITTGPPHSTHLVGLALKSKLGIKWIADFRDPWSDIYYNDQLLRTKWANAKEKALEKKVLSNADVVVANCPSNAELLRTKVDNNIKIVSIENGFDDKNFSSLVQETSSIFKIVYTGTMAASYRPEVLFESLMDLKKQGFQFELHLAGRIEDSLLKSELGIALVNEIKCLGYLPHIESVKLLKSADCLFNIFPLTGSDKGIPGKLFEYLAARKPIVNIGPKDGDAAAIIKECEVGRTFERKDAADLTTYLKGLIEAKISGLTKVEWGNQKIEQYSRRNLTQKYAEIVNKFQ